MNICDGEALYSEMTYDGQVVAAFLQKRLADNLQAFQEFLPDVYHTFKDYEEKNLFLTHDSDGNINVLNRESGQFLYGKNPVGEVLDRFDEYKKSPITRPYFTIGIRESKTSPVHNKCMKGVGAVQSKLFSEALLKKKLGNLPDGLVYNTGGLPKDINSFFLFSVGLGFDIEKLYLEHDIRRFYIVENNFDIFYCSMQLIDWSAIIDKCKDKKSFIYIGLSEDSKELTRDLVGQLSQSGRHNAAGCFLYSGFYDSSHEDIFKAFKDDLDLTVFAGYGFYDDSRLSLAHSCLNFKNRVPCIKSDKKINKKFGQEDVPVFVVGNGPSLDADIEYIKNYQDKAVIISCGSSLRSLYVNGIVPDFHAELERTASVATWIKKTGNDDDFMSYLKKIRLVAMSQVHPEVFNLFDMKGQMPKDNESGSLLLRQLFGDEGVSLISRCSPSCVHTGFTFAVLAGFKRIYFFGVDMGFKDKTQHHSKHSLYGQVNDKAHARVKIEGKKLTEFPANFDEDEVVYSYRFYPMFKRMLEASVIGWNMNFRSTLQIFNCSDGAKIKGAEPIRSKDISFSNCVLNKAVLSDQIMASYFAYEPKDDDVVEIERACDEAADKVDLMCEWLKNKVVEVESVRQAADIVDMLSYTFHEDLDGVGISVEDSWIYSFFDGTLLYLLSAVQSTLFLPIDEDDRIKAFNDIVPVMHELFDDIKYDFRNNTFGPDKEEFYDIF